jgi:site-specific recombinase XerD
MKVKAYMQSLLGHESLETTVVYAIEIVEGLKSAHRMYHPGGGEKFNIA